MNWKLFRTRFALYRWIEWCLFLCLFLVLLSLFFFFQRSCNCHNTPQKGRSWYQKLKSLVRWKYEQNEIKSRGFLWFRSESVIEKVWGNKNGMWYLEITLLGGWGMGRKWNSIIVQVLTQGWRGLKDGEDMIPSLLQWWRHIYT